MRPETVQRRFVPAAGFTLLEILIVLAILGILLGIIGNSFLRQTNVARLRESATQFAGDLSMVRSSVFQFNRDGVVRVAGDGKSYSVQVNGATSQRTLPAGTTITPANTTVTYAAPYAELSSTPVTLTVRRTGVDQVIAVRTVGVLGEVITNAQ